MAAKNGQETNSVIGEGSIFEGKFYINGSLQIDGKFEGEIRTEDQVVVGELGKVRTDIQARRVVVAGTVIGNIDAESEVMLLSTGRVLGNIRAPRVNVEDGVVVTGEITISAGQKKDVRSVIEESYEAGPKLNDMIRGRRRSREGEKESPQDA
jgi:cytoskeletal protein CcmA (bactofilin family)